MGRGSRRHRHMLQVLNGGHLRLWNLHLNLVSHSGLRVSPVIRRDETARRCRRQKRATDSVDGHAQLSGTFPIYIDVNAWIVQWFVILQITESADASQLRANLLSESAISPQVRPAHVDLHWCGSSKIHD